MRIHSILAKNYRPFASLEEIRLGPLAIIIGQNDAGKSNILRAQDKLAETAIEMYRSLAASHGCQLANTLEKEIESFRIWPGTKKMPD